MTSIAEPARPAAPPSWVRTVLLVMLLALLATQSPGTWGSLWLLVPLAVAVSLLAAWRFGAWGVLVPVLIFATALTAGAGSLWVWWIPAAALTGTWMGLREEGAGPTAGARAWMTLPLLLFAIGMPWMLRYPQLTEVLDKELRQGDRTFLDLARQVGTSADRLGTLSRTIDESARMRTKALPFILPTLLFVWMAILATAGRTLAARIAGTLRWPALSRSTLRDWRLPDGAVWLFLLGLGMLVAQWNAATPAAWTLVLNAALGFGIQGIAVVQSLLLARGVPPSVILVTMAFVFTLATPVFLLSAVAVGLSDVWLDYRRIEATDPT